MYMMMLVLDDPACLDRVLEAWSTLSVTGATILESTGLHRRRQAHVPMRYAYGDSSAGDSGNITLFAVVEDENSVRECLKSVEQIVGDLDEPNTGIFSAWPITVAKGIPSRGAP